MVALATERIGVWDVKTHQLIHELISPYTRLPCNTQHVAFSSDSTLLAVSNYCTDTDWTGHVLVWEIKSGELLQNWEQKFSKNTSKWPNALNTSPAPGLAFLPGSSILAFANGNTIEVVDVRKNQDPVTLELGDSMFATGISISADGRKLFAFMDFDSDTNVESISAKSYAIQIWNLNTRTLLRSVQFPPIISCCAYFVAHSDKEMSLFGTRLTYIDYVNGRFYATDLENGSVKHLPYRRGVPFLSSDGNLVLLMVDLPSENPQSGPSCDGQSVELWNANTQQSIYTFHPSGTSFYLNWCFGSVHFDISPDHKQLAIGHDGFVTLWDISGPPDAANN